MATIAMVVQAIDRASATFRSIAYQARLLRKEMQALTEATDRLNVTNGLLSDSIESLGRRISANTGRLATNTAALKANTLAMAGNAQAAPAAAAGQAAVANASAAVATNAAAAAAALNAQAGATVKAGAAGIAGGAVRGGVLGGAGGVIKAPAYQAPAARVAQPGILAALGAFLKGNVVGLAGNPITAPGGGGGGGWTALGRAAGGAWWGGFGGVIAALGNKTRLFGGIFGTTFLVGAIANWHLLADSILEVAAFLIPASIAAGAFGAAASDAAKKVYTQFTNMHTVMDATNGTIAPLNRNFEKLHKAVTPTVYQLLGDALDVIHKRANDLTPVVMGAAKVFQQLGARASLALQSADFRKWTAEAVPDLKILGTLIGNVFGILGNLLQAVPGYAMYIFSFISALAGLVEALTHVLEPVLKLGLALHGFIIWVGLATTLGVFLITRFIVPFAANLVMLVSQIIVATRAWGVFEGAMVAVNATGGPILWITAIAAGLAYLIYRLVSAKSATSQLTDTLQKNIDNAPSVAAGFALVGQAQHIMSQQIVSDQKKLADTQQYVTETVNKWGTKMRVLTPEYKAQSANLQQAQAGLKQFNQEAQYNQTHLQMLANTYGKGTDALGLLNAAGITQTEWQDHSAQGWLIIQQQVAGTIAGYEAMGQKAGTLGNDLDVLNRTATDQYQAMQKLNQAWQQFISDVTAPQSAFDTFAQGLQQMAAAPAKAAKALATAQARLASAQNSLSSAQKAGQPSASALTSATDRLRAAQDHLKAVQAGAHPTLLQLTSATDRVRAAQDHLSVLQKGSGVNTSRLTAATDRLRAAQLNLSAVQGAGKATIDGLNKASLALNQQFTQSVVNATNLFSSWRTAGLAQNLFNSGVKGAIQPLLKYAVNSQEATAQLVALAEQAGYKGPISFRALVNWLGKSHQSLRDVKNASNQATIQTALLTGAMQAQGSYISSTLLNDLQKAELAYSPNLVNDAKNLGKAIAQQGTNSSAAHAARVQYANDLILFEKHLGLTNGEIVSMAQHLTGLPKRLLLQLLVDAKGKWKVRDVGGTFHVGTTGLGFAADGAYIRQGTGPRADDVPIRVSKGELVVPTHLVNAGAVNHLRGKIPGFAAGGLVGNYGSMNPAGLGAWTQAEYSNTVQSVASASAAATAAAIVRLASTGGFSGTGGFGANSGGANAALARRMMPAWGHGAEWAAWNYVGMRESGWNAYAANPTSNARGIAQNIQGWGPNYQPGNAPQQIAWMINYIRGRYGDPIGAAAHERAFNWYDKGGWLAPGLTLAMNATGRHERVMGPGEEGNLAELLKETNSMLAQLVNIADSNAEETAAGVAAAVAGLGGRGNGRSAVYGDMYGTRG